MSLSSCLETVSRRVGELAASFLRRGGDLSCSSSVGMSCAFGVSKIDGMDATLTRNGGMSCAFGLVCSASVGYDWPLWASDQMVLTVDGGKVYVTVIH